MKNTLPMKNFCEFLEVMDQNLITNGLILAVNFVIALYNMGQLRRSTHSKLAGRKAYVLLLLLPLFHASLSPLFLKFNWKHIFILKAVLCWLNVLGLRAYIKVVKLASGGVFEIQESLELVTYSDGYIKLGCSCISCFSFRSYWVLFVFLDRSTYLFFLQPIFMMFDTILTKVPGDIFSGLSYVFLSLDILVTLVAIGATYKITRVLRPLSHLTKTWLKLLYVLLVVLLTQVQFCVFYTIIFVYVEENHENQENCDIASSVQGLSFLIAVEMVVVGFLGSVCFPLSDLLLIRAESVKPPRISEENEHIDFLF